MNKFFEELISLNISAQNWNHCQYRKMADKKKVGYSPEDLKKSYGKYYDEYNL